MVRSPAGTKQKEHGGMGSREPTQDRRVQEGTRGKGHGLVGHRRWEVPR